MSKGIKVTDEVYARILSIQKPRETMSEAIGRALDTYETIQGIRDGLPASHYLQQRPGDLRVKAPKAEPS